jgi:glycosyltransferase involved in cell wall biosynthesis
LLNGGKTAMSVRFIRGSPVPRRLFHLFPTFAVGGSQVRLTQIANHFGARYQHTIFATDGVTDALSLIKPHVPFGKLEAKIDKLRGLKNTPLYARLIREADADVVVTHNWGTIEWAFATRFTPGVRHVHIEDGFGPDEANKQLTRRVLFRKVALGGGRTTVVVPSYVLHDIATRVWRLPKAKVQLIPNGIDLQRFAKVDAAQARALAKKAEGEVLIGTVATLRPEKSLDLLIRAFAQVPGKARLMIVGDGPERARLESAARDAGVAERVTFFGHTREPERVMRAFDIFAMSSKTEQMPLGLLEAMACGLPVAATNVGDIARMVAEDNRKLITPAGDAGALAGALKKLVEDIGARAWLGSGNLAKAKAEYDQALMFERYAKLFG